MKGLAQVVVIEELERLLTDLYRQRQGKTSVAPHRERETMNTTHTYHLEYDSTALYLWRYGGPCVCIFPVDQVRQEAERFARLLLAAANGPEEPTS